jgi:VWFA-related protein
MISRRLISRQLISRQSPCDRMFSRPALSYIAIATALACSILVYAKPKDNNKEKDKEKENSEVKFTARTELVLIPTLVTDKSGNHISGLKKEDFTVLENGAEQKIATFEEITSKAQRPSHPNKANEFSNSLAGDPSARRITIVVLDLINTPFVAQASGRQELLRYLTQSLDVREPTALYTLTRSGLQVIHDFTTDPRILVAALHKVKGDAYQMVDSEEDVEAITGTASPDGSGDPGNSSPSSAGKNPKESAQASMQSEAARLQSMLEDSELNFQSFEQRLAITYTLDGLQQVAQGLAGYPGRKALIWASGGFPFNVSDNTMQLAPAGRDTLSDVLPLYEHTWQLLNDAQVALYPVDIKGLQVVTMPSASVRNPGKNYGRHASWRQMDTQASFQTFASMTGGRAYYNSNDLVKGFRDAVNDSAEYYMLGYYLDQSRTKSGWRKLAVKVKREHVEVRARNGFFVTNATVDPEMSRVHDVSSALQSPLDYTSIELVARWVEAAAGKTASASGTAAGAKQVNYQVRVAPDASIVNEQDNNHFIVEVLALARTTDGKSVGQPVGQRVENHLTAERLAAFRKSGFVYNGSLQLAPGEYTVRFVVRDDLNGRIGSVAAPLKVE